ncbi:MAG: mechanosensitive ion channel family protein [Candidatus Zixiibacteriota bacterium]
MINILKNWLVKQGISENFAGYISLAGEALVIIIIAFLSNYVAKKFLLAGVSYFIKKSRTKWDDFLLKQKVFRHLSHLAPALVIYFSAHLFPPVQDIIQRFSMVYMILVGLLVFNSFLNAIVDIYNTFEISYQRPIKGYIQIAKIIISVFIGIIALATLMGRDPWLLLSGLGAMTAILLLVFKDTILGLVASIQLSMNDMVRIGDWIEMPKYGADGDVIDITLHTIKVQNWDKTIATIPAYSLISDSFKNWRGMSESGGRRIKRAINIDMSSIKFCNKEMLDRFEKFQLITDYIQSKRKEIADYNNEHNINTSELINGRNMTNVGTFRAYIVAYLRNHPKVHQNMTFLIRHLPPGENGLPIEIYIFSTVQEWADYEAIQADIFDHILAIVPEFELRIFQYPTSNDFQAVVGKVN